MMDCGAIAEREHDKVGVSASGHIEIEIGDVA
jgi:hypothetical protein